MRQLFLKACIALLAGFVIVGCGGSSSSAPKVVTIVTTSASGVAFKPKNGDWQTNLSKKDLGTKTEYTIEYKGKYQVAIKCGGHFTLIAALDSAKDNKVVYNCSLPLATQKHYKGSITDSTADNPDGFVTAMRTDFKIHNTNPANFDRIGKAMSKNDFVAISYKNISGTLTPKRFFINRDIMLNSDINGVNVDFTTSNTATIGSKNFTKAASTDTASLYLITKNDTYFTSQLSGKWYYPNGLLESGDLYLKYAKKGNNFLYDVVDAPNINKEDIHLDIAYINNLTQLGYNTNKIIGLQGYVASNASQELKGYTVSLENSSAKRIFIIISKEYLDGDSTFEIEDLSGLANFSGSWDGQNASSVDAYAIMSNISLSTILNEGKPDHIANSADMRLVKNSKSEIAYQKVK